MWGGRCSHGVNEALVAACGLARPRRARALPRAAVEKAESKKVARDFLFAVSTQSHPKR